MTLQEHADKEALELAVISLAHRDLLGATGGLDGGAVGKAGFGEGEQTSDVLIGEMPTDLMDLTKWTAGEILLSGKMGGWELFTVEKLLPSQMRATMALCQAG
jgi:hypothetical protein